MIKKLFFVFIFTVSCLALIAKNQYFQLEIYDEKYIIGDNLKFKEIGFADEDWKDYRIGETIDYNKKPFIYWIRFKFDNDNFSLKQPAIALGKIGDVDEVFFNGELIGFNGYVDDISKSYYHYVRLYGVPNYLVKDKNIVAIRAKKSSILGAGIHSGPVNFGEYEQLRVTTDRVRFLSSHIGIVLCFFSIMVGLYHLYLYFRIKVYKYNLLYFFFSLFSALFIYSTAWGFTNHFTDPAIIARIHALTGVLTTISYLLFVLSFLNLTINYWHKLLIIGELIVAVMCFFSHDVDIIVNIYRLWFFAALYTIAYAGYLYIKHFYKKKRTDLKILIYSVLIMFLCAAFDSLYGFVVFSSFQVSGVGIFALNIGIIFSLAYKFTSNYVAAQKEVESYEKSIYENALQVAHDIRSPLTALNVVSKDLSGLPEGSRLLLRSSIQRIQDIANNLVSKNSENIRNQENELVECLLLPVIEEIVSEKRYQLKSKAQVDIILEGDHAYGLFAKVDTHVLKRILSNLINNSIEAFEASGAVIICMSENLETNEILINIKDNGKGIPKNILPDLGKRGMSYGKVEHEESGSGLGLYYAKNNVEQWGGSLSIESEEGEGTRVEVCLPKIAAPNWFVPCINLFGIKNIVILDDDESVHKVWEKRLEPYIQEHKINLKHARHPEAFEKLIDDRDDLLCLCDYELLGYEQTGLKLIENNGLEHRSILVTSRYSDTRVQDKCKKIGLKIIPKTSADIIPFDI